jgi:hypothetical protein
MPDVLRVGDVAELHQWPLGQVMTRKAAGENWTDVLAVLVDEIRLGGRYNSRRVRYDGVFYIVHNGQRVQFDANLTDLADNIMKHVYGVCAASDARHNTRLKGY